MIVGHCFKGKVHPCVSHDCVICDFVAFAPRVRCNGRVHIGDYTYIGTDAVIRQGSYNKSRRFGIGAVVGMGAVITKDVPDGVAVVGNPVGSIVK